MADKNGKKPGDPGYDPASDPNASPDLGEFGDQDTSDAAQKRERLRELLALLGYDLPVSLTDLTTLSEKLTAIQKSAGDALKALMERPDLGKDTPGFVTKLENLIALQDQLEEVGSQFVEYANDYFAKDDKSRMTESQAAKYLDRDSYSAWLKNNGFSGERLAAELADYDSVKGAQAAAKATMTPNQAARYLKRDEYEKYLTSVGGFTGDRLAAELKDYDEANKDLTQPTKTQAIDYMTRGEYSNYLSDVLHYSGARLNVEMKDYDAAHAQSTSAAKRGGLGYQGEVGRAVQESAAAAELRAKMGQFQQGMAGAAPRTPRVPTQEEFLADFDNAFDRALANVGEGGGTNEMEFARRVLKPQLLSKYTAQLGAQAAPFRLSGDGGVGGQGAGLPITSGGGAGAGSIQGNLAAFGIDRSSVVLPTIMPGDFLAGELTAGQIKLAYEGSSRGAGQFRSAGTGTTVARRT